MITPDLVWPEATNQAQATKTPDAYSTFQTKYWSSPRAFVHDCIVWSKGKGPTFYQDEILDAIPTKRRVSTRGPHGLGKTAMAAWVVLWFALTRDGKDWKVVTTASAWRQLTKYLWPEIHKWVKRLRWDVIGRSPVTARELLTLSLKLETGEAFAVASDNAELIEGAHADQLLYLFDEAKAIIAGTFDAAEGAFSGGGGDTAQEAFALAISTPGEPQGRFYDIHSRKPGYEDWWVRRVTLEEAIKAGRVSAEWAEQRKRQWGEKSAVYQNRVAGEFAASDAGSVVIPLAWVELANERWREWNEAGAVLPAVQDAVGVDVGRGGDRTVLAPRYGWLIPELRRYDKDDTMVVVGWVVAILMHGGKAIVDAIGIGAGVFDRLRELGKYVEAFVGSHRSEKLDRSGELGFVNKRAAGWWNMREILDPAYGEKPALPPDDDLIGELTAPHWRMMSGGKIQVEAKEEVKERIGRSTDNADAVIQAYWQDGAEAYGETVDAYQPTISSSPY